MDSISNKDGGSLAMSIARQSNEIDAVENDIKSIGDDGKVKENEDSRSLAVEDVNKEKSRTPHDSDEGASRKGLIVSNDNGEEEVIFSKDGKDSAKKYTDEEARVGSHNMEKVGFGHHNEDLRSEGEDEKSMGETGKVPITCISAGSDSRNASICSQVTLKSTTAPQISKTWPVFIMKDKFITERDDKNGTYLFCILCERKSKTKGFATGHWCQHALSKGHLAKVASTEDTDHDAYRTLYKKMSSPKKLKSHSAGDSKRRINLNTSNKSNDLFLSEIGNNEQKNGQDLVQCRLCNVYVKRKSWPSHRQSCRHLRLVAKSKEIELNKYTAKYQIKTRTKMTKRIPIEEDVFFSEISDEPSKSQDRKVHCLLCNGNVKRCHWVQHVRGKNHLCLVANSKEVNVKEYHKLYNINQSCGAEEKGESSKSNSEEEEEDDDDDGDEGPEEQSELSHSDTSDSGTEEEDKVVGDEGRYRTSKKGWSTTKVKDDMCVSKWDKGGMFLECRVCMTASGENKRIQSAKGRTFNPCNWNKHVECKTHIENKDKVERREESTRTDTPNLGSKRRTPTRNMPFRRQQVDTNNPSDTSATSDSDSDEEQAMYQHEYSSGGNNSRVWGVSHAVYRNSNDSKPHSMKTCHDQQFSRGETGESSSPSSSPLFAKSSSAEDSSTGFSSSDDDHKRHNKRRKKMSNGPKAIKGVGQDNDNGSRSKVKHEKVEKKDKKETHFDDFKMKMEEDKVALEKAKDHHNYMRKLYEEASVKSVDKTVKKEARKIAKREKKLYRKEMKRAWKALTSAFNS